MSKRYDWSPPVMSLLFKLQKEGVQPYIVNDGEEIIRLTPATSDFTKRREATEIITSVDDSAVGVEYTDVTGKRHVTYLSIVLGNYANEILSDYGIPECEKFEEILEEVSSEFYDQWEGRAVPLIKDKELQTVE